MNREIGAEFQYMLGMVAKEFDGKLTAKEMAYFGVNTFAHMAYFCEKEAMARAIVDEGHFDAVEELRSANELGMGVE